MLATSLKLVTKYNYLSEKFEKAYNWLSNHDPVNMEDGRYDITDGVFAIVQRYQSIKFEDAKFESHKDYIDIQYIAKGYESFGQAYVEDCTLTESYPKDDLYFYNMPNVYTQVTLRPGDLVVVPPEEAHQPRVLYKNSEEVVKVVIKVSVK